MSVRVSKRRVGGVEGELVEVAWGGGIEGGDEEPGGKERNDDSISRHVVGDDES